MTTRKLPFDTIKISPHEFRVDKVARLSDTAGAAGVCGEDTQEIHVDDDLGPTVERETVLHECMHAIWHQTNLDRDLTDIQEEAVCWAIAPRLLALLRENPLLTKYLLQ